MDKNTEAEADEATLETPKLSLFTEPHGHTHTNTTMDSPDRSGIATPPLQTIASVPFRWEEEPGKPRQRTTALSNPNTKRCLDLPPRLLSTDVPKLPSPTTVLDGPYNVNKSTSPFKSFSFRIIRKDFFYGSFRRSPEKGYNGYANSSKTPLMFGKRRGLKLERGFLGSFGLRRKGHFRGKREEFGCEGDGYVFPESPMDKEQEYSGTKKEKLTRTASFSSLSQAKSQFWVNIYEGLKQVVPWRSKKLKKDGHAAHNRI